MMLRDKILSIYPQIADAPRAFAIVITLQNDGDERGDYIAAWNHPTLAKPTDEQLAAL